MNRRKAKFQWHANSVYGCYTAHLCDASGKRYATVLWEGKEAHAYMVDDNGSSLYLGHFPDTVVAKAEARRRLEI